MKYIKAKISLKKAFFTLFLVLTGSAVSYSQKKISVLCTQPVISASADVTICNSNTTVLTALITSSTVADYTYAWLPSGSLGNPNTVGPALSNTTTATPSVTTTYTVTVTDNVGCTSNPVFVTVTVNPSPTVTVTGSNTVCNGSSVTLSASGGATYVWAPGGSSATSITVSPTTASDYTVTGTDANNCTNTATYSVSVFSVPSLIVSGTNTLCNGFSTSLNVSGASSYVWSPSGSLDDPLISNPVAGPSVSTHYTVVATGANGCTATSSYSVTVYATPTVTITGVNTVCSGAGNISLTGNGASTYVWNPGSVSGGTLVVSPTSSGTYTVTGTDGNGCTGMASESYTVYPQPTANAGPDVSVCAGDNTTLIGTGNGTFLWSPSTGLSCTTCANPVSTPTGPITYTLTVTNDCGSASDEIAISYPVPPSANAGPDITICPGGSTTLAGSGSGTVDWSPAGSLSCTNCINPVASPSVTTVYTFSVTGSCGTNTDQVTVTMATPTASISGNTTVCSGQTTTLTASGGISYVWSTGASTNPITDNPTTVTSYTVTSTDGNGCTATDIITVNPSPLPTANAGSDVSICSGSVTTLTATGNGTYLWAPATDLSCTTCANPTANPTGNTTYTLTVTNNCGSTNDEVLVSITLIPSVNAGADASICIGQSASLNASGSGTYNWSPTAGLSCTSCANPVANPTGTTNYTVTITDVCGTASDVVTVNVNLLPTPAISGNGTICQGTADTLVATGGGTYLWNGGSTNDSLIVSPGGTTGYTVTVTTSAGCFDTASFTVNVNSVTAVISGTANTVCTGGSSTLTASGGGTYVWNTGSSASSLVVTPTSSAAYSVVVTDSFGCTDSDTYSVSVTVQPTASVSVSGAISTVCSGTAATLNASGGANYSWSTGASTSSIVVSPTASSNYTVTVSNGACSSTASLGITVNPVPTASITAAAQTSICIGNCNTLSASGGVTYVWSPGGQTDVSVIVCPSALASYTVTTTDANGCTDDATVLINVLPQVVAGITGDTVICNGDATLLSAQGGGTYSWNTGATTSSISVSPAAASGYTVLVSNGACTDTAVINVSVDPSPSATGTASPYTINIGATTTLSAVTSTGTYTWSPTNGLSCDTCQNPAANPTVTTIYTVMTTDSNGCTAMDTVIVYVTMECEEVFVPSAFSPNNDGFNDFLYVRNPCVRDMEFSIYNRWGQKVFFTDVITVGWDGNFNGKPVDPAVFFYTLKINFITGTSRSMDGNVTLVR